MADDTNQEEVTKTAEAQSGESGGGNGGKIAIAIIVVLLVAAGAFIFLKPNDSSSDEAMEADSEEMMSEEEKAAMEKEAMEKEAKEKEAMEKAMMMEELESQISAIEARAALLRPELSTSGVTSLDIILVYVADNPEAVLWDESDLPEEIQDAVDAVRAEAEELEGTATTSNNTGTIITSTGEEVKVTVGEQYEVTGVLNKVVLSDEDKMAMEDEDNEEEVDEETGPILGNPFTLTLESGGQLYFLFNDANTATLEPLEGENVDVTVEVVEVDTIENIVTYRVVSMPTLAETTQ